MVSTVPRQENLLSNSDASEGAPADTVEMLRALAHPVRLGIMRELAAQPEVCACDFTDLFSVRQPTISQHLKVLRAAGLVQTRRRGTQICYSIRPDSMEYLNRTLTALQPPLASAHGQSAR